MCNVKKPARTRKAAAAFVSMALTCAILFTGCSMLQSETPATASKTSTQKVTRGDLVLGLSADGRITLPVTGLDFAVSGIIKNIYVSPGDTVKKGDLLAELDDTDLQLALNTAQNNLDKALLAYDEAVATAEYNIKAEQLNLQQTQRDLNTDFDDYNYQQSIENAELSLSRREQDYNDTLLANEADENAARLTLERKQAELEEAKAELAEAEAATAKPFDEHTYQNSIKNAQATSARLKDVLEDAEKNLKKVKDENFNDLYSIDPDVVKAAEKAIADAQKTVDNADRDVIEANRSINTAKNNLKHDAAKYAEEEAERLQNEIDAARKNVEAAQRAVDDAQTTLDNVIINGAQKAIASRNSIDDAQTALLNAQEELSRGVQNFSEGQDETKNSYDLQALRLENMLNADSSIQNALYNIEDARTKLESAENDLAQTRITAPIDGMVLDITKKIGEKVTENESAPGTFMGSTSTSNSFMTIRDMSEIYLTTNIPEGDIVGLSVGQKIRVAVDALGEENIYATVYSVSSIPNTDASGIITYEVIGLLDELNDEIRDSMSVFLTFIKREITDVMLIPNKSIFMEDGTQYVYVQKEDGSLEKRAVTCGFTNGTQTELKDGLEVGETVIVGKVSP